MPSADVCVLASGGLDSAVLLERLSRDRRVFPLYVAAGHRWESAERHWLERFLAALERPAVQPLEVLRLDMGDVYGRHWSTAGAAVPDAAAPTEADFLPGRNLILLAKAAVFCYLRAIPAVAMGHLRSNPHPDARPAFFRAFEAAAGLALDRPLEVLTPFRELTKAELIGQARDLPLGLTFTCMDPAGLQHCGRCLHCHERRQAFAEAGIPDPAPYAA